MTAPRRITFLSLTPHHILFLLFNPVVYYDAWFPSTITVSLAHVLLGNSNIEDYSELSLSVILHLVSNLSTELTATNISSETMLGSNNYTANLSATV
jgi:hypothetical protein